jgi:hypothetical protein
MNGGDGDWWRRWWRTRVAATAAGEEFAGADEEEKKMRRTMMKMSQSRDGVLAPIKNNKLLLLLRIYSLIYNICTLRDKSPNFPFCKTGPPVFCKSRSSILDNRQILPLPNLCIESIGPTSWTLGRDSPFMHKLWFLDQISYACDPLGSISRR